MKTLTPFLPISSAAVVKSIFFPSWRCIDGVEAEP